MDRGTKIGIIGGSGLYEIEGITEIDEHCIDTPFGEPSDLIISGKLGEAEVFFLPRHGRSHGLLPTEVNYRANIYALKSLGVTWCIGIGAVGSLEEDVHPGDLVVPDQLIDRTRHRPSTFFGNGIVAYPSFAEPFCPVLREGLIKQCRESQNELTVHDGGTYLCMEGPALSTRAESHMYRSFGARIIGMTCLQEAKLAREAEIAYASICMVTDYDCWKDDGEDVEASMVLETLIGLSVKVKAVLPDVTNHIASLTPSSLAADSLKNALVTDLSTVPPEKIAPLQVVLSRYL